MNKIVRVGTRDSLLALWQASQVKKELEKYNIKTEIIKITSKGDTDLTKPLYEFGVSGIFTKSLDKALLNKKIDIAVHSLKDVPTKPADGVKIKCVLSRENPIDVLVLKNKDVNFKLILKNCNNIWKDNLIKLGGDYLIWSNSPENPNHN